jgi:hypothetical protein
VQKLEARFTGIDNLNRDIVAMARDYTLRRPDDVYDFLKKEPSAIALVSEAHGRIREHFPKGEIFMEVLRDPGSPIERELLISISTSLPPSDAVRKLDAFDDSWWLGASSSSPADICIKVEYR